MEWKCRIRLKMFWRYSSVGIFRILLFYWCILVTSANDVSDITWTHEVDNVGLLRAAVATSVSMLVVDVSLGPNPMKEGDDVMSPPVVLIGPQLSQGDVTLDDWLDAFIRYSKGQGVKLNFQDPDAIVPALKSLRKRDYLIGFPVWLHGDVLDGPINASASLLGAPVAGDFLLKQAQGLVPWATVSMGWATSYDGSSRTAGYSWKHVVDMANICRCNRDPRQSITFVIRSVFVRNSFSQLRWLLDAVPGSTLTIRSTIRDVVIVDDLLRLRTLLPFEKVYYDLPTYADQEFRRRKGYVPYEPTSPEYPLTSYNWMLLPNRRTPDCWRMPYVTPDSIVLDYVTDPITLILTNSYSLPLSIHGVLVPYRLLDYQNRIDPYANNRFTLFYSSAAISSSRRMTEIQASRPALEYTVTSRKVFSDCTVQFIVRFTENGVVCAVNGCEGVEGTSAGTSANSKCNTNDVIGRGPIAIGFSFEGWRGWAIYNLTISEINSGVKLYGNWLCSIVCVLCYFSHSQFS